MVRGNKGEWSEFYAFLKLLVERKVYGVDSDLNRVEGVIYNVSKIIREAGGNKRVYVIDENGDVFIEAEGDERITASELSKVVKIVFQHIVSEDGVFEIEDVAQALTKMKIDSLNAGNSLKGDLEIEMYDQRLGKHLVSGYSIKSKLGSSATLLNASSATNFTYGIDGIGDSEIREINLIDSRSKIRDRIEMIRAKDAAMAFCGMKSDVFMKNLRRIDYILPDILAEALMAYYSGQGRSVMEIIRSLETNDVLINSFDLNYDDYRYKMGNLLHAIALGMVPASEWSGDMHAHGGFIIIQETGELVCYNAHHLDDFKLYLLKSTRFETASSSRHGFGLLYKEGDEVRMDLNLQIRFI